MQKVRFSLRWIMGGTASLSVACLSLTHVSKWCAAAVWTFGTVALVVFVSSQLGVMCQSGRRRAFWLGFALVGWTYPTLIFGPWFRDTLATNIALVGIVNQFDEAACQLTAPALKPGENIQYRYEVSNGRFYWVVRQRDGATTHVLGMSRQTRSVVRGIGHGCVSLLVALLGGVLAQRLYLTKPHSLTAET
ncbi:MAG TPA: hypothetical protein VMV69_24730 [Pirellulales bacterium]|nr:hypothetical protein [Pirellulales bacterium]